MPANLLHTPATPCLACGHIEADEDAWELAFGALAGEVYTVGERLHFDEAFSFFDQRAGSPRGRHRVAISALCPGCDLERRAHAIIEDARILRVEFDTP